MSAGAATTSPVITQDQFLAHWQGHRGLTRRVIEAFPEEQLFTFAVGGMRPFGALVQEMLAMTVPTARGLVTNEWSAYQASTETTKAELLRRWDEDTTELNALFPRIPLESFQETKTAFGQYTMPVFGLLLYVVDNEIHHRAQGYVYLRALGVEPPPFWERT